MTLIAEARGDLKISTLCAATGLPRSTWYRAQRPRSAPRPQRRPPPPRTLSPEERAVVLDRLHEPRFADQPVREVYNTLLSEGTYTCSASTMYRILREEGEVRERRDQRRHPAYQAPELLATAPNQVWSWDITKLRGPAKWSYFYLYVILDIFSRYIVGWMVAPCESASLAEDLIGTTCDRQMIAPGTLTLHADRGAAMTSKLVSELLSDLGVTRTHSRPQVSDDNPYSESNFKTLKYRPEFPDRFGSIQDARSHITAFVAWYNQEHHHSGIAWLTPETVHFGRAEAVLAEREKVLAEAYARHPERWVRGAPKALKVPVAAWINPPRAAVGAAGDGAGSDNPSKYSN